MQRTAPQGLQHLSRAFPDCGIVELACGPQLKVLFT